MSITAFSSFYSIKKIKLQENIEWELSTPLELEDFEKKSLFCLLKCVRQNYHLKWYLMPFGQKYYLLSKQCFVRKFCCAGGCLCDALKFIEKAKKEKIGTADLQEIVDINILNDFDNVVVILD